MKEGKPSRRKGQRNVTPKPRPSRQRDRHTPRAPTRSVRARRPTNTTPRRRAPKRPQAAPGEAATGTHSSRTGVDKVQRMRVPRKCTADGRTQALADGAASSTALRQQPRQTTGPRLAARLAGARLVTAACTPAIPAVARRWSQRAATRVGEGPLPGAHRCVRQGVRESVYTPAASPPPLAPPRLHSRPPNSPPAAAAAAALALSPAGGVAGRQGHTLGAGRHLAAPNRPRGPTAAAAALGSRTHPQRRGPRAVAAPASPPLPVLRRGRPPVAPSLSRPLRLRPSRPAGGRRVRGWPTAPRTREAATAGGGVPHASAHARAPAPPLVCNRRRPRTNVSRAALVLQPHPPPQDHAGSARPLAGKRGRPTRQAADGATFAVGGAPYVSDRRRPAAVAGGGGNGGSGKRGGGAATAAGARSRSAAPRAHANPVGRPNNMPATGWCVSFFRAVGGHDHQTGGLCCARPRRVVPSIGPQNGGIAWCCTAHTACEGWPQRRMARGVTLSGGPGAHAAVSRC